MTALEFDGDGGFLMAIGRKVRYHSSQLIKKIAFCIKKKFVIVVNLPFCSFLLKKKKKKKSHFII